MRWWKWIFALGLAGLWFGLGPLPESRDEKIETTVVAEVRTRLVRVEERLRVRRQVARDADLTRAQRATVGFFVALAGLAPLILLVPLLYWRRFAAARWRAFGYAFVGMLVFALSVFLFSRVVALLKQTAAVLSAKIDPQDALIQGVFSALQSRAADYVGPGPAPFGLDLERLEASLDFAFVQHFADALTALDPRLFAISATVLVVVERVVSWLPWLVSAAVVLLFAWSIRDVLLDSVRLPFHAVDPSRRGAWRTFWRTLWRALLDLIAALFSVLVVAPLFVISTYTMGILAYWSVTAVLQSNTATLAVADEVEGALAWVLACALAAFPIFLVCATAMAWLGSYLLVSRTHRLLRDRLRGEVRLHQHWRFWCFGLLAVCWLAILPTAWLALVVRGLDLALPAETKPSAGWVGVTLALAALVSTLGFAVVARLCGAWDALKLLVGIDRAAPPADPASESSAPATV